MAESGTVFNAMGNPAADVLARKLSVPFPLLKSPRRHMTILIPLCIRNNGSAW